MEYATSYSLFLHLKVWLKPEVIWHFWKVLYLRSDPAQMGTYPQWNFLSLLFAALVHGDVSLNGLWVSTLKWMNNTKTEAVTCFFFSKSYISKKFNLQFLFTVCTFFSKKKKTIEFRLCQIKKTGMPKHYHTFLRCVNHNSPENI